jgi:ABC-type Fe3+/spermidine/putrescine transport system ATPase subunit
MIGGFEQPNGGAILINGERVEHLPPYRRDTATIFQSGALFPHKTVAENIAYGLRMRGVSRPEIADRVKDALQTVRLSGFEDRYPNQLSGGQKQRVALARSMALRPAILLFDEPLSALDLSLRLQLRAEIKRLHEEIGFSAIYVTHDQSEAMSLSDRIVVMNKGMVEQVGLPIEIFQKPANEFVYNFVGESCCLPLVQRSGEIHDQGGQLIKLKLQERIPEGMSRLYVRPSRIRMNGAAQGCANLIEADVQFVEFLGDMYRYHFSAGKLEFFCDHPGALDLRVGETTTLGWDTGDMRLFS